MKLPKLSLVVAFDNSLGIGLNNKLPWNIKNEMEFFKQYTSNREYKNTVIMGYNTWKSIPEKYRPLKNRKNIIVTKNYSKIDRLYETHNDSTKVECYSSIDTMLNTLEKEQHSGCLTENGNKYYIIGGKQLYELFLLEPNYNRYLHSLCISRFHTTYNCDTFFPFDPKNMSSYYTNIFTYTYDGIDRITNTHTQITCEIYLNKKHSI